MSRTHPIAVVTDADRVVVMQNGDITEAGANSDLLTLRAATTQSSMTSRPGMSMVQASRGSGRAYGDRRAM